MHHIRLNINESDISRSAEGKKWEEYDTIECMDGTIIDMQKLINDQAKARAALIHLEPVFSNFVGRLMTVYTFHVPTQATDGKHYFVNPQFTNSLTFEEKVFLLAHECMHCVLDHMRRGKNHNHEKSNIAADYEVNQTLVDMGLFKSSTIKKLDGLIDTKYSSWSYERIYDDNPPGPSNKQQNQQNNKQNIQGQQGSGQGSSQNQQHSQDYKDGWNQAMADYKAGKLKI